MPTNPKLKKRKRSGVSGVEEKEEEHTPGAAGDSKTSTETTRPAPTVPTISYRWLALRFILVTGSILGVNIYYRWQHDEADSKMTTLISATEKTNRRFWPVECSQDYEVEREYFSDCVPRHCGRVVMDNVVTQAEAQHMLRTAKAGLSLGGSNGGASILDLHSGALSMGNNFVSIYKMMQNNNLAVFNREDFNVYRRVKEKMHHAISTEFGIPYDKLHLTHPMFFSQMSNKEAQTVHDEYWQLHIDREQYGTFHYTSLLYLTDYGEDFTGGRFVFVDKGGNSTVEPRQGRMSFFTSASENPHYVERVESGVRYAVTVPFTCDPEHAISTPTLEQAVNV